jgi:hypothetical protein
MFRLNCHHQGTNKYIAKTDSNKIIIKYFVAVSFCYIGVSSMMVAAESKHVAANKE